MREKIAKISGLPDVTTDLYVANPQVMIEVDREKTAVYGVTIDQVRQELYDAFGTRQVATIYTPSNDYQVILEAARQFRAELSKLTKIFARATEREPTRRIGWRRLRRDRQRHSVGSVDSAFGGGQAGTSVGPLLVNHQGQQPAVTISFNLAPGYALGEAVDAIKELEREDNLPATITTGFQGTAQVFQESLKGQGVLILAAIFAAYVVLGILYESFIHPITIISGLPSAGIGALLTLILFRMDLSVIAMIGIVMLVGIVKKNAIMMVEFAIGRRRVGLSAEAAIREACLLRIRPIMMTTSPRSSARADRARVRRGRGAPSAARRRGGRRLVLSQLLTLFITPVIYLYLDRIDRMLKRRLEPQLEEVGEPADERRPAVAAE